MPTFSLVWSPQLTLVAASLPIQRSPTHHISWIEIWINNMMTKLRLYI